MHDEEFFNNQQNPPKAKYKIWPDSFYAPCPTRTINGKKYTESQMFTPVEGFVPVSQYDMLTQNNDGRYWDRIVEPLFRDYNITLLKTYMSTSY